MKRFALCFLLNICFGESYNYYHRNELPPSKVKIKRWRDNIRDHSFDGRPTLKVQSGENRIKIRYV